MYRIWRKVQNETQISFFSFRFLFPLYENTTYLVYILYQSDIYLVKSLIQKIIIVNFERLSLKYGHNKNLKKSELKNFVRINQQLNRVLVYLCVKKI